MTFVNTNFGALFVKSMSVVLQYVAPMTLSLAPRTAERARAARRLAAFAGLTVSARLLTSSLRLVRVSSICSRICSGLLVTTCPRFLVLRQGSSLWYARSAGRPGRH